MCDLYQMSATSIDNRLHQHPLGFWEIISKPDTKTLAAYNAEKYYQEAKGSYELEYTEEELKYFRAKLNQRFSVIERGLPSNIIAGGGTMLDVGCGEGFALAFFREKGWQVKGFDFSSAGIISKNPGCADSLVTGDVFRLLQAEISAGCRYDIVWLQNVLEPVIDPLSLLALLRSLVSPAGMMVVTVPNEFSIVQLGAIMHRHIDQAFWVAPPDHLNYFDYASLMNVSHATGWECIEILGDFPIDSFLFHPGSNYIQNKTAGKFAHRARIQLENIVNDRPLEDVLRYWSAAAKLGIGRDFTAFLQPEISAK
jgi:2-polyprenyl-3-methyl-5-hydroxy-6-metoxy-1,4-benzoquinol methylase